MDKKELFKAALTNMQQFKDFLSQYDYSPTAIRKSVCAESADDCEKLITICEEIWEEYNDRDWCADYDTDFDS